MKKNNITRKELDNIVSKSEYSSFCKDGEEHTCKIGLDMYREQKDSTWTLYSTDGIKPKMYNTIVKPFKDRGKNYYR
tara:strand:- start:1072 stop:1302 length:231 start_codon:yes stop_codon:yes gene_type:complete